SDMLDHLHAGDEIELALQLGEVTGPIIDGKAARGRVVPGNRDQLRRGVEAGYGGAQPRERLGEKSGAATDVQRGLSFERRPPALVKLPVLVNLVADVLEADRVQLVQHGLGAVRVPPVGRLGGELLHFIGDDAGHAVSMPSSLAKRKNLMRWNERWTISSSSRASFIARTCHWPRSRQALARRSMSIRPRRCVATSRRCARHWKASPTR